MKAEICSIISTIMGIFHNLMFKSFSFFKYQVTPQDITILYRSFPCNYSLPFGLFKGYNACFILSLIMDTAHSSTRKATNGIEKKEETNQPSFRTILASWRARMLFIYSCRKHVPVVVSEGKAICKLEKAIYITTTASYITTSN